MLKCGSSTQTGRPSSKGTNRTFWRKRGTRSSLASTIATMSAYGGGGPSKIATEAMCMWDTWSSMWRNDASRGLNRSGLTDPPFRAVPARNATTGRSRTSRGQPALAAAMGSPSEASSGVSSIWSMASP